MAMTIEPFVLAPILTPDALIAKKLCCLLANMEVARPGLGRSIACLMNDLRFLGMSSWTGLSLCLGSG